ncbi:MAG: hypothetical protein HY829_01295 [Actinobacteria bacterium]|nr:hypothetical protein [Actinomycetota bacterium]
MTVVLVPVSRDQVRELRQAPLPGPLPGFAVTPALLDTFGLAAGEDEEADRTALLLAGLSALLSYGRRLALVVETAPTDTGDPFGEVTLAGLAWPEVSAIFADAPEAEPLVRATAEGVVGLDLDAAWDTEEVQALLGEHDLLWYGPEEAEAVLGA